MMKSIVIVLLLSVFAFQLAHGLKCYSCTENQKASAALSRYLQPLADTTIPACGNDINKWHSATCSEKNPVCSSVILTIGGQNVLTRSCSSKEADVCKTTYPGGIVVAGCQTCTTDLCNGIFKDPELPTNNGTCDGQYTIDINVNVNVNKEGSTGGSGSGGSGSGGSGSGGSGSGGSGSGGSGSGNNNN